MAIVAKVCKVANSIDIGLQEIKTTPCRNLGQGRHSIWPKRQIGSHRRAKWYSAKADVAARCEVFAFDFEDP